MSSQAAGQTAQVSNPRVNEFTDYRWQSADKVAWDLYFEGKRFSRTLILFEKAVSDAEAAGFTDYRRGSSLAGKALSLYQITKSRLYKSHKSDAYVDPTNDYLATLEVAQSALSCYQVAPPPAAYAKRYAELHLLVATLMVHLCRPAEAEQHFEKSISWFKKSNVASGVARPKHALGKLYLCQREFVRASVAFRQVWKESSEPDRAALGFLDYVNTQLWLGNLRQARQLLMAFWKPIEGKLEGNPVEIHFRAKLLFAKSEIAIGNLSSAGEQLVLAEQIVQVNAARISQLGKNVMWILASEVAVRRRNFSLADDLHGKIQPLENYPLKGFGELELIAIDAGCRQCITECLCICQQLVCDCCCPSECCFVCSEQEITSTALFDFTGLFTSFAQLDLGRAQLYKGDVPAAESNLQAALNGFSNVLHPNSPINLRVLTALIRAKRIQNDSDFPSLVERSIDIAELVQRRPNGHLPELRSMDPLWIDLFSISGGQRYEASNYEFAEADFFNAIRVGEAVRSSTHEKTLLAHVRRTDALICLRSMEKARESITQLQNLLADAELCDPWFSQVVGLQQAKMLVYCRQLNASYNKLGELERNWLQLQNSGYSLSNLAETLLWKLIVELEKAEQLTSEEALGNERFQQLYSDYVKHSRLDTGTTTAMIAHQLNRVAMLLEQGKFHLSSVFLYRKAIELYSLSGLPLHQQTVEGNLQKLERVLIKRRRNE